MSITTTLGIDLGTNSLGWALIEEMNGERTRLIDCGCFIFQLGVNLEKGTKEVSPNALRQQARGMRRRNMRVKFRLNKLSQLLEDANMLPQPEKFYTSRQLFQLRAEGLEKKLYLDDFGRILLHIAQRRGFKSNKLADSKDKDTGVVKEGIAQLKKDFETYGCKTIGQYFYFLYLNKSDAEPNPDSPPQAHRIRARWTAREMYLDEVNQLWEKQKEYYPDVLTDELYKKIVAETIFYQRPLKSKKHLIRKCRFEKGNRTIIMANPLFQEFRYWQKLADLRLKEPGEPERKLTLAEKQKLAAKLETVEKLTKAAALKELGFNKHYSLNDPTEAIPGNKTRARIRTALGEPIFKQIQEEVYAYQENQPPLTVEHKIWQMLTYARDVDWIINWAKNTLGLAHGEAQKLAEVNLEDDYGSVSAKALRKILPYMQEQNMDYTQACKAAGYHHSHDEETQGKDRPLLEDLNKLVLEKPKDITSPIVRKAVNVALRLIRAVSRKHGKPTNIHIEMAREFKKTKPEREALRYKNQDKNQLRAIYAEFLNSKFNFPKRIYENSPEVKKYELWLELGLSDKEIEPPDFIKMVKNFEIEKYRLWMECGRISIYTGQPIGLERLFSPEIEIEHIIPYSRSMNDGFVNKTLCEASVNKEKGNLTPFEYFHQKKKADKFNYTWDSFRRNIERMPKAKRRLLEMEVVDDDFFNSQLTNNAWAARVLRQSLAKHFRNIVITNGQATAALRKKWGLNEYLDETNINNADYDFWKKVEKALDEKDAKNPQRVVDPEKPTDEDKKAKNRLDHRHHTIDAIVIACTNRSTFNKMAYESKRVFNDRKGWYFSFEMPDPWATFRDDVREAIAKVLVVHENRHRLFTTKTNKYRHRRNDNAKAQGKTPKTQKVASVRGPLHEETLYGKIIHPVKKEETYVVRKPLDWFDNPKKIERIIDPKVREIIQEWSKNKSKDKEPPYMYSRPENGYKVPIKRIRVADRADAEEGKLIPLRPDENPKLYVKPGNNYLIAIYEGPKYNAKKKQSETKRDSECISLLEAVKRRKAGKPICEPTKDGLPLKYVLQHNDLGVIYEESPTEIEWNNQEQLFNRLYRVIKFSGSTVWLGKHNRSKIDAAKDVEPLKLQRNVGTLNFVKVRLNILGEVEAYKV